ncbi:hypothetical protein DFH06DRAFT_1250085 [Mycena polygramma]|nr:hypothetical protein DFH06DRAFT_1250085 [Mycena polygramma]
MSDPDDDLRTLICRGLPPPGDSAPIGTHCGVVVHTAAFQSHYDMWMARKRGASKRLSIVTPADDPAWRLHSPLGRGECGCVRYGLRCGSCGRDVGTVITWYCGLHNRTPNNYPYWFDLPAVWPVTPTANANDTVDQVVMRTTHPPTRREAAESMHVDVEPESHWSVTETTRAELDLVDEDDQEPSPPYFADQQEARKTFIGILETYLGELDPDAEIALPTEKSVSVNMLLNPTIEDEEQDEGAGEQDAESQARLWHMAERISRERAMYEARVRGTHPVISNPRVADIDFTPDGKMRLTVHEMALQFAEQARRMAFYQAGAREQSATNESVPPFDLDGG